MQNSLEFCKIHKKATVPESVIRKETLLQVFSSNFAKIFKNTFFAEHLREIASEHLNYTSC